MDPHILWTGSPGPVPVSGSKDNLLLSFADESSTSACFLGKYRRLLPSCRNWELTQIVISAKPHHLTDSSQSLLYGRYFHWRCLRRHSTSSQGSVVGQSGRLGATHSDQDFPRSIEEFAMVRKMMFTFGALLALAMVAGDASAARCCRQPRARCHQARTSCCAQPSCAAPSCAAPCSSCAPTCAAPACSSCAPSCGAPSGCSSCGGGAVSAAPCSTCQGASAPAAAPMSAPEPPAAAPAAAPAK